jgi:RNA polymerase sigma-70 factor (ECF subfamily)
LLIDHFRCSETNYRRLCGDKEWAVIAETSAHTKDTATTFQQREEIKWALRQLTEKQRTCVVLRHFEDLPFEEIGHRMGMTANAARFRNHAALASLRRALSPQE